MKFTQISMNKKVVEEMDKIGEENPDTFPPEATTKSSRRMFLAALGLRTHKENYGIALHEEVKAQKGGVSDATKKS